MGSKTFDRSAKSDNSFLMSNTCLVSIGGNLATGFGHCCVVALVPINFVMIF